MEKQEADSSMYYSTQESGADGYLYICRVAGADPGFQVRGGRT